MCHATSTGLRLSRRRAAERAAEENEIKWGTIEKDLASLASDDSLDRAMFLFHTPPYDTPLDRAALDGKTYEHVPLDVHVGSIAVRRFIERRQPLLTLHGHVHEAARLTGEWKIDRPNGVHQWRSRWARVGAGAFRSGIARRCFARVALAQAYDSFIGSFRAGSVIASILTA